MTRQMYRRLANALPTGTDHVSLVYQNQIHVNVCAELGPGYVGPLDGLFGEDLAMAYTPPESISRVAQMSRMHRFRATNWTQHFERADTLLSATGALRRRAA